eukprot:s11725_g2.t1
MENIREPQPLKDSIAFVYDTDVHQLASFIRSGPPLGKEKEKGEKVEKKVEEDPPSIPADVDKSDKSISSTDTQKDATPPNAGSSIPVDAASAAAADPSIPAPSTTTLPSVRKPNIDPDDRDEEWEDSSWNQSWGGGWSWHYHQ